MLPQVDVAQFIVDETFEPKHPGHVVKLLVQSIQATAAPELFATWASLQELNRRLGADSGWGILPIAQAGA